MKITTFTLLAGFALATAAQAGTANTALAPASGGGLWQWFAGGSVGHLTQLDEEMYSLQVGAEYKKPGDRGTQAFYLQVGFAQDDASYSYSPGIPGARSEQAKIDLDIIPITLNYKYEAALTGRLNYYLGLGLGVAILNSSYDWSFSQSVAPPGGHGGGSEDRTDVRLYGDVFAGLAYDVSDSFKFFAGVRYIFMDDMNRKIDVTGVSDYSAGINNDVLIELGARYRF